LAPVTIPLFVVSAVFLMVGALACSRLSTICALGGCALAYLGMFALAGGASSGGMSAMVGSSSAASKAVFSVGAILIVASFVIPPLRRRRGACAPVLAALSR